MPPFVMAELSKTDPITLILFHASLPGRSQWCGFPGFGSFWMTFGVCWNPLISAFPRVAFLALNRVGVDAFEQHDQIRSFKLDWFIFAVDKFHVWKSKSSDLEFLREDGKAIDVVPEGFDEVSALAAKEEQVSAVGVVVELVLHQRVQPGE